LVSSYFWVVGVEVFAPPVASFRLSLASLEACRTWASLARHSVNVDFLPVNGFVLSRHS
jgi:hypothetical protein